MCVTAEAQAGAFTRTHLRHLDRRHGVHVEAEDLGAVVADHEALHLLLVHGEVAGLDVEVAVAREAQHVLALGVPGYAVSIGLLWGGKEKKGGRLKKKK